MLLQVAPDFHAKSVQALIPIEAAEDEDEAAVSGTEAAVAMASRPAGARVSNSNPKILTMIVILGYSCYSFY